MLERSKRKLPDIHVGDNVRVAVTDFDRSRGMHRNIIGVVMQVSGCHCRLTHLSAAERYVRSLHKLLVFN